ncbi:hypothetical protein ACFLY3_00655 [Chloroflexota bacterium]
MIIVGSSIRKLDRYLDSSNYNRTFIFGVQLDSLDDPMLDHIGFSPERLVGDSVLPASDFGPISRYNADGKVIVHKDQPMETAYRQAEWRWQEWRGRYDTEEQSKIVDIPYDRYPRTFVPPPSVELTIGKTASGKYAALSSSIELSAYGKNYAIHIINLFLEIFGRCEVFTESLKEMISSPLRRLNWRILPPGEYPWPRLKSQIDQLLQYVTAGKRKVIEYRLEVINSYGPAFYAIGQAGFRGYIVFGFPDRNLFVLESMYFGNATYVFAEKWEDLSKKTKAEILSQELQKDRIIHREGWQQRIHKLLVISKKG